MELAACVLVGIPAILFLSACVAMYKLQENEVDKIAMYQESKVNIEL